MMGGNAVKMSLLLALRINPASEVGTKAMGLKTDDLVAAIDLANQTGVDLAETLALAN